MSLLHYSLSECIPHDRGPWHANSANDQCRVVHDPRDRAYPSSVSTLVLDGLMNFNLDLIQTHDGPASILTGLQSSPCLSGLVISFRRTSFFRMRLLWLFREGPETILN